MSNAPYCPVSYNQVPQGSRTQPPGSSSTNLPPVHNLREVITAISRINNVVQQITRGAPQINNIGTPPVPLPTVGYARITWKEANRSYQDQEVVNPDDHEQKIKIKTLAQVNWVESAAGHQLTYEGA